MKRFNRSAVLSLLFASAVNFITPKAHAVGDANEMWVSARTNALGTSLVWGNGSITNPYYGDFDYIMYYVVPATARVHLLPGVHFTKGNGFYLWPNVKLIGAGIDVTTIRRDTNFFAGSGLTVLTSFYDGVEVSDMTIDANATGNELVPLAGVEFFKDNYCSVRRVKVINCSGNLSQGAECPCIVVGDTNTVGNSISDCEASSFRGNYGDGICLNGQGNVAHNRVFFPSGTNNIYIDYGVGIGRDAIFLGNYAEGGDDGVYADTLSGTNLCILDNHFHNIVTGILLRKGDGVPWNMDGVTIRGNVIDLSTNEPSISMGIGVQNINTVGSAVYQNVDISGNTIRYVGHLVSGANFTPCYAISIYSTGVTNFQNVRIVNNTIDRNFYFQFLATGVWIADNSDLLGVPLHVRSVGSGAGAQVTLTAIDGSVLVTSTTTTNLSLPGSFGFNGKEVLVVNQTSGSTFTVSPSGTDSLLPSSPVSLSPHQTARFIADGTSTWIKQ